MNTEPIEPYAKAYWNNQSESISELAKALSAAQGKMQAVPRNAENPFFKSSYADLSSIIAASRDILAENGLSIVQFGLPTENGKVALATQLNHISGQWVRGIMMAKPVKDDPQAMGSCVTYLRRYGFSAMLGLVQEGEDDDGNQASEGGGKAVKPASRRMDHFNEGDSPSAEEARSVAAVKQTIAQKHAQVFGAESMNYEGRSMKSDPSSLIPQPSTLPSKTPPAASQPTGAPETPAEKRERFLSLFRPYAAAADKVFRDHGLVLPTDDACDIDDVKISLMTNANVRALLEEVKQVHGGKEPPVLSEGDDRLPDDLHNPADYTVHPPTDEPWRNLLTPFSYKDSPPAGTRLGDLDKKYLYFWVMVWAPKKWQDKEKRWHDPKEAQVEFFNALKQYRKAIAHRYNFTEPEITP